MIEHVQLNSKTSGLSVTAVLHQKKKLTRVCVEGN